MLGLPALGLIAYLIAEVTRYFVRFAAAIADFTIGLQDFILENDFVEFGWKIVRDVANLGFVLVIIIIAFAVILRFREYGTQKLLFRLIAAAILVNFSLTIAGVFINFSQVVTNFFWSRMSFQGSVLGSLMSSLNPTKLFSELQSPNLLQTILSVIGGYTIALAIGPLFMAIFNIAAIFVFMTMALLFLIRFIYLTFLLVISPIVWLFWVIPAFSGQFKKWWHSFFNWVFFAPASAFFIYLAFQSASWMNRQTEPVKQIFEQENMNGLIAAILAHGINMILILGFLIGGLIAAKSMGVKAAEGAVKIAEKTGKGIRSGVGAYTKAQAERGGAAALRSRAGQSTARGLQQAGNKLQGLGIRNRFTRAVTNPIRRFGRGLTRAGTTAASIAASPPKPSPSLLGSVLGGIAKAHGLKKKMWRCLHCNTNVGPSKNPPGKCPNATCISNTTPGTTPAWI